MIAVVLHAVRDVSDCPCLSDLGLSTHAQARLDVLEGQIRAIVTSPYSPDVQASDLLLHFCTTSLNTTQHFNAWDETL